MFSNDKNYLVENIFTVNNFSHFISIKFLISQKLGVFKNYTE